MDNRSVGSSPMPLQGSNFSVEEIWSMSQRNNQVWGLADYEVPIVHHDAMKMERDKRLYEQATGKTKKPPPGKLNMKIERGGAFDDIKKHALAVPAPWKYDLKMKWISGYQNLRLGDITPRAQKKLGYKWRDTPADKQDFDKEAPTKAGKPHPDAKKNTFIDQIIKFNTKKNYPLPSPCSYHLDEKLAKKFHPENADKCFAKPHEDKGKTNLPKAPRDFILIAPGCEKLPAPSKYDPKEIMNDAQRNIFRKAEFLAYKKYKEKVGETNKRHKEILDRDQGRHKEIVDKLKDGIVPKNPRAIPVDIVTFDKYSIIYKDIIPGKAQSKKGIFSPAKKIRKWFRYRWQIRSRRT